MATTMELIDQIEANHAAVYAAGVRAGELNGGGGSGVFDKVVATSAEIGDTLTTNIPNAIMMGNNNTAIIRGRKIISIDSVNGTCKIDDTTGLAAGDKFNVFYFDSSINDVDRVRDQLVSISSDGTLTFQDEIQSGIKSGLVVAAGDNTSTDIGTGYWLVPAKHSDVGTELTFESNNTFTVLVAGSNNRAGLYATVEGYKNEATAFATHVEGWKNKAYGERGHAEGYRTQANGYQSHTEGFQTIANADNSHAEGERTKTSGTGSHAEGSGSHASGPYSHAEGGLTQAIGPFSHAEGESTRAVGKRATSFGRSTQANGENSLVMGNNTISNSLNQLVFGRYNEVDNNQYIEIAGNGNSVTDRKNARTLDWDGNETIAGSMDAKEYKLNGTTINFNEFATDTNIDELNTNINDLTTDLENLNNDIYHKSETATKDMIGNTSDNIYVMSNDLLKLGQLEHTTNYTGYITISSAEEFIEVFTGKTEFLSTDKYILTQDIDFNEISLGVDSAGIIPVASYEAPFAGEFNGNGFVIKNLHYEITQQDVTENGWNHLPYYGLFAVTSETAYIHDLGIEDSSIKVHCWNTTANAVISSGRFDAIGMLAGKASGTFVRCWVNNCQVLNTRTDCNEGTGVGGMFGKLQLSTNISTDSRFAKIVDCYVNNIMLHCGQVRWMGGLFCYTNGNYNLTVLNTYVRNITITNTPTSHPQNNGALFAIGLSTNTETSGLDNLSTSENILSNFSANTVTLDNAYGTAGLAEAEVSKILCSAKLDHKGLYDETKNIIKKKTIAQSSGDFVLYANQYIEIPELTGELNLSLSAAMPGFDSEWSCLIKQGESAYTIILPEIDWYLGIAPTFAANTATEIRLFYKGDVLTGVWI